MITVVQPGAVGPRWALHEGLAADQRHPRANPRAGEDEGRQNRRGFRPARGLLARTVHHDHEVVGVPHQAV